MRRILSVCHSRVRARLVETGPTAHRSLVTAFGDCPQIQAGGLAPDLATLDTIVHSPDWDELRQKLEAYVTDFHHKIVPAVGGFQL